MKLCKFGQKDHLSWYRCTPVLKYPQLRTRQSQLTSLDFPFGLIDSERSATKQRLLALSHHHWEGANMIHSLQGRPEPIVIN